MKESVFLLWSKECYTSFHVLHNHALSVYKIFGPKEKTLKEQQAFAETKISQVFGHKYRLQNDAVISSTLAAMASGPAKQLNSKVRWTSLPLLAA